MVEHREGGEGGAVVRITFITHLHLIALPYDPSILHYLYYPIRPSSTSFEGEEMKSRPSILDLEQQCRIQKLRCSTRTRPFSPRSRRRRTSAKSTCSTSR
jgi:hypothetical protein